MALMIDSSSAAPVTTLRFTIQSDLEYCREILEKVMAEVDRLGYGESSRFALSLGFEEALVNAIKHGNKFDVKKKVYIEAKISASRAIISIEDEGPGFYRDSVPDPRCDENLTKCSGRGILLVESYMTSVQWANGGRRIIMMRENRDNAGAAGV